MTEESSRPGAPAPELGDLFKTPEDCIQEIEKVFSADRPAIDRQATTLTLLHIAEDGAPEWSQPAAASLLERPDELKAALRLRAREYRLSDGPKDIQLTRLEKVGIFPVELFIVGVTKAAGKIGGPLIKSGMRFTTRKLEKIAGQRALPEHAG